MELHFFLRYNTQFGETLWVSGNSKELGNGDAEKAIALEYLSHNYWHLSINIPEQNLVDSGIKYNYLLKTRDGEWISDWGNDRIVGKDMLRKAFKSIQLVDTWNHAGEYENVFYTRPFQKVLLREPAKVKTTASKTLTHSFRVKAPLLQKNQVVCLLGNHESLHNWNEKDPILLSAKDNWWTAEIDLSGEDEPVVYKYGIYNLSHESFVNFESGDNRTIPGSFKDAQVSIIHDGFIQLPNSSWKGAGVAIPVFSLKSKHSFGVGEFTDIKLLVDWAKATGLKLIQLLPVNDTIASNTWVDSYPYAAVSAFALHPLYINLEKVAGKKHADKIEALTKKQKALNALEAVDYEEVMRFKLAVLKELYELSGDDFLYEKEYKNFVEKNDYWVKPYAAFCYFRDKYNTSEFLEWKTNAVFNQNEIDQLFSYSSFVRKDILFYCFVQYHLHLQLKNAADYAHKKGIVLKGDIPIGIYRHGADAWVAPELYNMEEQAGAPPDSFTPIGQNWGFPTYNWKRMQEDGFNWWKQRFEQISEYFDAFRIDHILGFFRIWSIPNDAVQGVMGHFVPSIPVHFVEFGENGLWFDEPRYCLPFINEEVLQETFAELTEEVKENYLSANEFTGYQLLPAFDTQIKVATHFYNLPATAHNEKLRDGLFYLISNVILFKAEGSNGLQFHFRIAMDSTSSFRYLIPHVQDKLRELYTNYFYRRQDEFWRKEALNKLPYLKAATNMMVCGEDLGMVPHCVPEVMQQLGILSLEIQRMPKNPATEFFLPDTAPYLSVITPSTHDMSTIRGWWEEDRIRTQRFYNTILNQQGNAPYYCEAWINRAIILQHLNSPAMWSIFQLQDIFGMSETLRRSLPQDERINDPAVGKHYWRYRMHLTLEELLKQEDFNEELRGYVQHAGRIN